MLKSPEELQIEKLTKERDFWKEAWLEQRHATGKAWWDGYKAGIKRAIVSAAEALTNGYL